MGSLRISVSSPAEDCVAARRRILDCLSTAPSPHSLCSQSSFSVIDPPASEQAASRPEVSRVGRFLQSLF